jgi:hypothetical protein
MMPPLPGLPLQRDSPQLIITNTIVSTMPARHRDRDSGSRRKLSTIRPSACPRRAGMSVHDVLESLDSISRNNQCWCFSDYQSEFNPEIDRQTVMFLSF